MACPQPAAADIADIAEDTADVDSADADAAVAEDTANAAQDGSADVDDAPGLQLALPLCGNTPSFERR